ncbi:MAG TPA: hypothetical protein VFI31_22165, partial [Pirellulales bacterium]|nr:hypothetical protein [Pirellulales bacterium]
SIRVLLAIVLATASFFAGMAVTMREANDLRSALRAEQESNAKTGSIMRQLAEELVGAKKRIKELEGREHVASVSADDLDSGKAVVIGSLGSPLKTMLNIRGTWQRRQSPKDSGPSFQVTHVNEKALDEPVVFHQSVVHARYPRPPWDKDDESKKSPPPSAGQTWEMRAYETGEFFDSPPEYEKELGMLLPYMEQAQPWRNFKVELHGIMQRTNWDVPSRR